MAKNSTYILLEIQPREDFRPAFSVLEAVRSQLTLSTPNLCICQEVTERQAVQLIINTPKE